jgi:hypothetical protein
LGFFKIDDEHTIFEKVTEEEKIFGDWRHGRYAWEFANMRMLDEPIPAKGKQGLWNIILKIAV